MLVAVVATAVAFLVAGMTLTEKDAVIDQTVFVGLTVLGALLAFSGSFGLIAVLILWATRRRSAIAFLVAGAIAGAAFLAATNLLFTGLPSTPSQLAVTAALGAMSLLIVRWIARIRAPGPPKA